MSDVDLVVRGGTIYDGGGRPPSVGDIAIRGDRIAAVGDVGNTSPNVIDADGLAVAPGFINMMSWSNESLIEDGRSQSEIRQGVTLEVMGEGWSMGPLTDEMKNEVERRGAGNPLVEYDVEWTTLGQYLEWLERRGVAPNVASFVGASTVRIHEMGYDARPATEEELGRMRDLVREAMAEGALGVASALIYPPATSSTTEELAALAAVAAELGGMYASHIRSEAATFIEAVEEFLEIARLAGGGLRSTTSRRADRPTGRSWTRRSRWSRRPARTGTWSRPTRIPTRSRAPGSTRASRRGPTRVASTRSSTG